MIYSMAAREHFCDREGCHIILHDCEVRMTKPAGWLRPDMPFFALDLRSRWMVGMGAKSTTSELCGVCSLDFMAGDITCCPVCLTTAHKHCVHLVAEHLRKAPPARSIVIIPTAWVVSLCAICKLHASI